jgi:galactose mutarotase-like enzyme
MREKIENEFLSIAVDPSGAELRSFFHKDSQKEYLWQGSDAWWPRSSPVLFPFVGKLNNHTYRWKGQSFSMPQHGFARDHQFILSECKKDLLVFCLRSSPESLKAYPFEFELLISYKLEQTKLHVSYEVNNPSGDSIYFSIGAHPGFNCPLNPSEQFSDYLIAFEQPETLDRHLLDSGAFNGETERVITNSKFLPLSAELFSKDALVFKNMKSKIVCLKNNKTEYSLKMEFPDFPYFGIWTKPGAPFVCLEPWCGLADNKNFSGEIRDKEGIIELKTSGNFKRSWTVEIC